MGETRAGDPVVRGAGTVTARSPVVVLGLDCPTGLQAARIFAAREVEVIGIVADPTHPCARTRVCRRVVRSGSGPRGPVETLLRLAPDLPEPAVLLPCTDGGVLQVARHRASLTGAYLMALPPTEVIELLLDKACFAEFAASHDLPIPRTRVLRRRSDAVEAGRELGFPVVLKPSIKGASWERNTSARILIARNPSELLGLFDRCSAWSEALVAQERIEGEDTDHYTCDSYFGRDGEPLVTFCTRKLRRWPPGVGQGCLGVECPNEIVRDTAVRVFRTAGHRGLGYLEMKRDRTSGRLRIIEANVGRPTGRSTTAEAAGVEMLMTMYRDLLGHPLPREREQQFRGVKWIHARHDLQACVRVLWNREQSLWAILGSWRGPRTYALFSWRDPLPFLADVMRVLRRGQGWKMGVRRFRALFASGRSGPAGVGGNGRRPVPDEWAVRMTRCHDDPEVGVDFHPGGIVRVRTFGARPEDLQAVSRDLGPPATSSDSHPDIVVHFRDRVGSSELRLLDGGSLAYGDDGIYILGSPAGPVRARLSPEKPWGHGRIVCRKGLARVPFLAGMVDLTAIQRGWIPLPASAWTEGGAGVLAAGCARSGRTGTLLSFCERGARPLGDARIFLSEDGRRMVGVARPVHVRDWHLAQLAGPPEGVAPVRRRVARFGVALEHLVDATVARIGEADGRWRRAVGRGSERVRRRMGVEVSLGRIGQEGYETGIAPADLVILLESHGHDSITWEPVEPDALGRRLAAMVHSELIAILRAHLCLRCASPGGWIGAELAPDVVSRMAHRATKERTGHLVRHPYPCNLEAVRTRIATLRPYAGAHLNRPGRSPARAGPSVRKRTVAGAFPPPGTTR